MTAPLHPTGAEDWAASALAPGLWCPECGEERTDNGWGVCPARAMVDALQVELCISLRLPLSLIDGRPWVPTHDEAHPEPGRPCRACEPTAPPLSTKR